MLRLPRDTRTDERCFLPRSRSPSKDEPDPTIYDVYDARDYLRLLLSFPPHSYHQSCIRSSAFLTGSGVRQSVAPPRLGTLSSFICGRASIVLTHTPCLERFSPSSPPPFSLHPPTHPFRAHSLLSSLVLFTSHVSLITQSTGSCKALLPPRGYSVAPFVHSHAHAHFALFAFEPCQFSFVRYTPTPTPSALSFSTVEFDLNCSRGFASTPPHNTCTALASCLLSPVPICCLSPRALRLILFRRRWFWGCAPLGRVTVAHRAAQPARICYFWNYDPIRSVFSNL